MELEPMPHSRPASPSPIQYAGPQPDAEPEGFWARQLSMPVPGWVQALVVAGLAMMTWAGVYPNTDALCMVLGIVICFLAAIYYAIGFALRIVALLYWWRHKRLAACWKGYFFLPAGIVIVFLLLSCRIPLRIAIVAQQRSMQRVADQTMSQPSTAYTVERLGLYAVDRVEVVPSGVRFDFKGSFERDSLGYFTRPPGDLVRGSPVHLVGRWYLLRP